MPIDPLPHGTHVELEELEWLTGDIIAHYTSYETATKFILPTGKIRMSSVAKVNDPKESRWQSTGFGWTPDSDDDFRPPDGAAAASDILDTTYRNQSMVLCTSKEYVYEGSDIRTPCFALPSLWEHYADSYTGVCFVLDRPELDREIIAVAGTTAAVFSEDIQYDLYLMRETAPAARSFEFDDVGRLGVNGAVRRHLERNHQTLFFRKHPAWRGESEFRWIVLTTSDANLMIPLDTALVAVVLGLDATPETAQMIQSIVPETPVYRIYWNVYRGDLALVAEYPLDDTKLKP